MNIDFSARFYSGLTSGWQYPFRWIPKVKQYGVTRTYICGHWLWFWFEYEFKNHS